MNEQEALQKMVAPGQKRAGKWRGGVIQIHVTRQCDRSCFNCTQGSNYKGPYPQMSSDQFEQALQSLAGYFGVVGLFGGNPALHKEFGTLCILMQKYVPKEQRGIWCNDPITLENAILMRETFNPAVSNLNVHLSQSAYDRFKAGWPECRPFGLNEDSRHAPVYVAMKDVIEDEEKRWELISNCDINQHWSASIGIFRGQLRAWFCEIAMAQSILHENEPDYPDTGIDPTIDQEFKTFDGLGCRHKFDAWWQAPMYNFRSQVRKHCHECGVPLRGYGELACADVGVEQASLTHAGVCKPKRVGRAVENVTSLVQLGTGRVKTFTHYIQNSKV